MNDASFDTFLISESNRRAHEAALQAAMFPGRDCPMLMLCGPCGSGKSHLLHSIHRYVQQAFPHKSALYLSSESFMEAFLCAHSRQDPSHWQAVETADVLLIDHVQFWHGMQGVHQLLEQLMEDRPGRQLAAASDLPLENWPGVCVTLDRPDEALSRHYLAQLCRDMQVELCEGARSFLLRRCGGHLPSLKSLLQRLQMQSLLKNEPLTLQFVMENSLRITAV